jgi:hypothetical protein
VTGPDERSYIAQVEALRHRGWRGFRFLVSRFLSDPRFAGFPSPVRWLWLTLGAAFGLLTPLACWWLFSFWLPGWAPVLVACGSPLLWTLARRALQDVTVGLLTVVALGCASLGSPWALAASVFALLATKEASAFALPAVAGLWLLAGHSSLWLAVALCASLALWLTATRALLGSALWRVLVAAKAGHSTEYTAGHQRGDWHRLWVDLAIVSPLPIATLFCAGQSAPALAVIALLLVAFHSLAPVRNVRTVLAADLVIRGLAGWAAYTLHPWLLAPMLAADALAIWRLRKTYDPVTATLTAAFGMTPSK